MKRLVVVAAERREMAGLLRRCHGVKRLRWPLRFAASARCGDYELLLVAHGSGVRLASLACETAWRRAGADAVISTGYSGALDPELRAGDIVVATAVCSPERQLSFAAQLPRSPSPAAQGPVVSTDRVITSAAEKILLGSQGFKAVEMEAAAVAAKAAGWGIPFFCIRAVTDLAAETFTLDFEAARDGEGRILDWRLLASALRSPRQLLPELWLLYKRSRLAAEKLGGFIAACEF